jgi:hypothetical protein
MIGRHEAQMIFECRRVEHAGEIIDVELARDICVMWQSPGRGSRAITAFAQSGKRLSSLIYELEREIKDLRGVAYAADRLMLRSVLAYVRANPVSFVDHECVIFLEGDEADEIMRMIYPRWAYGSASTGWPDGANAALTYMKGWDYGEPCADGLESEHPGSTYGTSEHGDDDHLMCWNFGLTWAALYRKIITEG